MKKIFFLFLLITTITIFVGCSNNVPLRGKVTFSDDGMPLPSGLVRFENETIISKGMIGSDGTYVLGTMSEKDGIPKGTYRVAVISEVEDPSGKEFQMGTGRDGKPIILKRTVSLIAAKYNTSQTSGITCTVDGSSKKFDFSVDRK